jgi:oligosaccharide repeat unit polymerase
VCVSRRNIKYVHLVVINTLIPYHGRGAFAATLLGVFITISCALLYLSLGAHVVQACNYIVGSSTLIICLVLFVLLSKANFSSTGVFSLASAFFVGLGTIYSVTIDSHISLVSLLWTSIFFSAASYLAVAVSVFLSPSTEAPSCSAALHVARTPKDQDMQMLFHVGLVGFLLSGLALIILKPDWELTLTEQAGSFSPLWSGLWTVSLLILVYHATITLNTYFTRIFACALLFLANYAVAFQGFGRLQLVALALAMCAVALFNVGGPKTARRAAAGVVASAVPFLWLASYIGQTRGVGSSDVGLTMGDLSKGSGLESVLLLLSDFNKLLDDTYRIPASTVLPAWGWTYWTSAIWFVPRSLWPEKPIGFGSELAFLLLPQYAVWGHTMVVTCFGELFYNFGWPGVIFGSAFIGWVLSRIDHMGLNVWQRRQGTPARAFSAITYALLVSGMVDFVWGGSGTFANREGTSLLVLAVVVVGFALSRKALQSWRL